MLELVNTATEKNYKNDFIAIGCWKDDDGNPFHSVFIIKYNNETYQYHYTGEDTDAIKYDKDIRSNCFHKITFTIHPHIIPSFIMMCKQIQKKANPRYGFFYTGEYFDFNGQHFSEKEIGQTMTCTGFCLNVLKGFLEENYIDYTEWTEETHQEYNYLQNFADEHGLNVEDIAESHRRISPLDLICSAYFSDLPIKKEDIDSKKEEVSTYLEFS